jgi:hypothetical protein
MQKNVLTPFKKLISNKPKVNKMKKFFYLLIILAICNNVTMAQVPNKFNYQAVARNGQGQSLANANISLRLTILDGGATGANVYSEVKQATTNQLGLFTVAIGGAGASSTTGNFAAIDWASGNKFIKVEADPLGGINFSTLGNTELLSVPYALYAVNGKPGPIGPQGSQGQTGLTGAVGPQGTQGPIGQTGAVGPQGNQGTVGLTGPAGAQGNPGPTGATGATGSQGPIGLTGPAGTQGVPGPTGSVGSQGPIGLTGATGTQGPIGLTGLTGATGATGPQGATGAQGPQGIPGAGTVSGTTNFIGKFTSANVMGNSIMFDNGTNVGVGNTSPAQKLDVSGNLRVSGAIMPNGDAGATGEVLTSNGAGNAPTWQSLAAPGGGKFWIIPANNSRSTGSSSGRGGWNLDAGANLTTQTDSLDYGSTNESGTDFTISNPGITGNFITVNRTGLYHFEGVIRYFVTSNLSVNMLPRTTLDFLANQPSGADLNLILNEDPLDKTGGAETGNGANNYNSTVKFQFNIHLLAGTTCTFRTGLNLLRFPSGTDLIAMGVSQGGYISGYFIAE